MEQFSFWDNGPMKIITPDDIQQDQYNGIDMECNIADDDDSFCLKEDYVDDQPKSAINTGIKVDFSDDDDDDLASRMIPSRKKFRTFDDEEPQTLNEYANGIPSADYGKNMAPEKTNKYRKTNHALPLSAKEPLDLEKVPDYGKNVKTSHGTVHYRGPYNGNPAREAELLNQDLGNAPAAGNIATGGATASASGEGGGCCEGVKKNKYTKLCEDLLLVTGFNLNKNPDKSFTLSDNFNSCKPANCANMKEVFAALAPHIFDFYICPLQQKTGENINNCEDWCKWYKENYLNYPECKDDMDICDLAANHVNDIIW